MNVYIMKNFTLREVYFGLADDDSHAAVKSHRGNPDSPVGHWKFDVEEIKWGVVQSGLHEQYARAFLLALRREPPEDGWVVVYGGE
jgi:hypothetical protein